MDTAFLKEQYIRFPKMDHFSDCFGVPTESFKHLNSTFYVSEKIDGANLGLFIPWIGSVSCFSRSGENACGGLFKFIADKEELNGLISALQDYMKKNEVAGIYLWGEYFGQNVCRRIGYKGPLGQFKFYDGIFYKSIISEATGRRLTPPRLALLADQLDPEFKNFFVKFREFHLSSFLDLKDALPLPAKSEYSNDNMEGYVISEVDEDYELKGRWKYKDPAFSDSAAKKKIATVCDPTVLTLQAIYRGYLSLNRAIDLLSKTTERTKLDQLVKALIQDAREDFLKDHEKELLGLSEKEKKWIYNAGSTPFMLIKEAIKQENYQSECGN